MSYHQFTSLLFLLLLFFFLFFLFFFSFFFNDTATTEIYTLSLHDALPIFKQLIRNGRSASLQRTFKKSFTGWHRSEERFSRNAETDLVCRLLLEKKKVKEKRYLVRTELAIVRHHEVIE